MEIWGKREFALLEKIGFTRIAGSPEELQAAEILKSECDAMGVPAIIEPFEIEQGIVEEAKLAFFGIVWFSQAPPGWAVPDRPGI